MSILLLSVVKSGSPVAIGPTEDLLQRFIDGDFDGQPLEIFQGEFPAMGDTLLATTDITGVASIDSPTQITLSFSEDNPVVLANSGETEPKYAKIVSASGPPTTIYYSIGNLGDDFEPDIILTNPDEDPMLFYAGDTLDVSAFTVSAIGEDITHYQVVPSVTSVGAGVEYTATFQARTASGNALRIGRVVTPTMHTVSGAGGGSFAEPTYITNRYGITQTVVVTAGAAGSVERIDVEDQYGFTGSSVNITCLLLNAILTYELLDEGAVAGTSYDRTGISVAAGNWLLACTEAATADGANTPTASGITFAHILSQAGAISGLNLDFFIAPCPSGFSGTVHFTGAGIGHTAASLLVEVTPSYPVATITTVAANDVQREIWNGSAGSPISISFNQSFSDPNNSGVAFATVIPQYTSTPGVGWAEVADFSSPVSSSQFPLQTRTGTDTEATFTFILATSYFFGVVAELQAVS